MSLLQEQFAFSDDVQKLLEFLRLSGYRFSFGEVYRTIEQQEIYWKTGRSKTMKSNHLRRCAIDLNIFKDGKLVQTKKDLQAVGDYWESLNKKNRAGMNYKNFLDVPHFERIP